MKEKNVKIKFNTFIGLVILLGILMTQGVFAIPTWIGNPWDTTINGFEDNNPSVAFNISEYITSSIEEIPLRFVFGDPQNISSTLYGAQVPSFYHWISLDSSTGIFTINATSDNQTGEFNVSLDVYFSTFSAGARPFTFNVSPVNDAPQFSSIENKSFNSSELFSYTVYVTDEENNIPFVMNISFLNCSVAEWSTRNCSKSSDMILFNTSNYNFDSTSGVLNLGFTPLKNDVGNYIINFSVMDNSSLGNKTTSQIVNFTVLNVNSAPYFRYVCDNERNSIENQEVACWINVSDVDELYNITFSSNYPWFTFYNGSVLNNTLVAPCNVSTSFNSSALVNFTSTDYQVGNWSVNITLMDTGGTFPPKGNSTIFWFFINNTEDNVSLAAISNDIVYENVTIYVDAIDNDLLVPDKSVKNEILTFASNTSWVSISSYSISGNITRAEIKINYDLAVLMGVIDAIVSVNVSDTGGNTATRNFTLTIDQDNAAVWNVSMANSFLIYENSEVYLNFTQNVSDADLDPITFSFTNSSAFPSFNINSSTGIINFTPIDGDVGYHSIIINAYDGKKDSFKSFNFTILNVNDNSSIETPLQVNANATVNITNSNIQGSEDSRVIITVWVMDDDFKIPSNQKSFYNESLNVTVNIQGVNSSLFRFSKTASFPTTFFPNRTEYIAAFTPGKADVGSYNITLNVTDLSNYSTVLRFNLTISSVNHPPVLANLTNQTSAINKNLYYRINASDIEDGDSASIGNNNFNFSYSFISGTNILNSTTFNGTSGEINITFNSSQGGRYHLNITVNDSGGLVDRGDFWIYVYDTPSVIFPSQNHQFNLTENVAANLTFRANHSLGDNLNFQMYIQDDNYNNVLRYNISYYGNNTNLTWRFTPNFTDETHGLRNLTLIVSNIDVPELNVSRIFNVSINHTNAPVVFSGHIGDSQLDYKNIVTINLSNYFSDIDYSDSYYNQTINFNVTSNSTLSSITSSISNWTLTLSSSVAAIELFNITSVDSNGSNVTSNSFEIKFTTPEVVTITTPASGSSGGGGGMTPVAFKLIRPREVSVYALQTITIPLILENTGSIDFQKINITSVGFKDGDIDKNVVISIDKSFITSLRKGIQENISLTVFFDTNVTGDYEILVDATSQSPRYSDTSKIYISLQEVNQSQVKELILFTENLIASNPECIEIKELLNEAKREMDNKQYESSLKKSQEAIDACKKLISGNILLERPLPAETNILVYLLYFFGGAFLIVFLYHTYRRMSLRRG